MLLILIMNKFTRFISYFFAKLAAMHLLNFVAFEGGLEERLAIAAALDA